MKFKIMASHILLGAPREVIGHGCITYDEALKYVAEFDDEGFYAWQGPRLWVVEIPN
jgi:hypothetical protein